MIQPVVGYKRHRFPSAVIAHAVWLCFRLPLSLGLVDEMLLERGIVVSDETIRCCAKKFGPHYAGRLQRKPASPNDVWHMDEVVVTIGGRRHWLRHADRHHFPEEGSGWEAEATAIIAGTANLDAAKKLIDWSISKEANEIDAFADAGDLEFGAAGVSSAPRSPSASPMPSTAAACASRASSGWSRRYRSLTRHSCPALIWPTCSATRACSRAP